MSRPSAHRLPFDGDCKRPALILGAVTLLGFLFALDWLWGWTLVLLLLLLAFFRDPPRRAPMTPGAVVSPADGKVDLIRSNHDPEAGPAGGICVSVFLSVFDVHINRSPYAGVVESVRYQPGGFANAMHPVSSQDNECNWIHMRCGPHALTVRQVAGWIARRIVCRVRPGDELRRGQRIGLIRFGSRTDLYLPPQARVQVEVGQRVKGGLTVIAYLPDSD